MTSNTPIKWRLRRGMLELDHVLNAFYEAKFAKLSEAEQACFATLLEEADPYLLEWLIYREPCPYAQFHTIIAAIHEFLDLPLKK